MSLTKYRKVRKFAVLIEKEIKNIDKDGNEDITIVF